MQQQRLIYDNSLFTFTIVKRTHTINVENRSNAGKNCIIEKDTHMPNQVPVSAIH